MNIRTYHFFIFLMMSWVCIMLMSLKYGWLDSFFWAAQHANVQGIDYFALPKSFLNLLEHRSPYDSWHGAIYGRYATWYLAHPLFSVLVMSWFSWLQPWFSYAAFVLFSLLIMMYCAFLFAKLTKNKSEKLIYYAFFLLSFPLYWMLYVGNMHAPLVLSVTLIYIAIHEMLNEYTEKTYNKKLLLGLLLSFFSKPIALLFVPALLIVKETRLTMMIALLIYGLISFLFIVTPWLNPEGVGLGKLFHVFLDFNYIKETMNIYKNQFVLTEYMKDNSVHWFNLIAQSGFRLNHIENFSLPVFLDTVFGKPLSSHLYNFALYFCLLNSFLLAFIKQSALKLQVLILTLMTANLSYFLSHNTVWEYQFTSVIPILALIFLQKDKHIFTKMQLIFILIIGCFFYLPSSYFLIDSSHITFFSISLIRASRTIPAFLLFLVIMYQSIYLTLRAFRGDSTLIYRKPNKVLKIVME